MKRNRFPVNYEGCISIFCDPAALSPSFGAWREILEMDNVYGAFGIHPHNATYYTDQVEERILECLKHPKAVAWGECGLDYFKMNSKKEDQVAAFERQIQCAVAISKPIVIHSRSAAKETLEIMRKYLPPNHPAHYHCFGDDAETAKQLITTFENVFIGLTGSITFDNSSRLRNIVRDVIPLNRILLETDGPYLTPQGFQSRVNYSASIVDIAKTIANLKGVTSDEVFIAARENTKKCFSI